ncbi:MAG: hypothetical protein ABI678_12785 [Kofleriaceae bacterium]
MTSLSYHGRVFDEHTDWLAFIRDAITGRDVTGLRDDVPDVNSSMSQLAVDLEGTDLKNSYCDALLKIVESGSDWERDHVRNLPYEDAPRGADRMLALLLYHRETFRRDGWVGSLLWHVLMLRPEDEHALAVLREEVEMPSRTSGVLELAAKYQSAWFIEKLPTLGLVPDGHQIIMWLKATSDRQRLMNALLACGPGFLDALRQRIHGPRMPPSVGEQFREDFARHPAFASILT